MSDKPELSPELDKGLILAIGGFCEQKERFLFKVNNNFVAMKQSEWLCNCPQGSEFGTINDLYGRTGKICKHICAIAIVFSVKHWVKKPQNIYAYLQRFININYVFDCQLPNSKVKIKINDNEMIIKIGHKKSGTLAIKNGVEWQLTKQSKSSYEDFVNDL